MLLQYIYLEEIFTNSLPLILLVLHLVLKLHSFLILLRVFLAVAMYLL